MPGTMASIAFHGSEAAPRALPVRDEINLSVVRGVPAELSCHQPFRHVIEGNALDDVPKDWTIGTCVNGVYDDHLTAPSDGSARASSSCALRPASQAMAFASMHRLNRTNSSIVSMAWEHYSFALRMLRAYWTNTVLNLRASTTTCKALPASLWPQYTQQSTQPRRLPWRLCA